ncbi:MAG: TIM barrel protein, partial [Planctomycetia bacterium]|nr:TIM barrel protein [Planctomycetia bacterium]
LLRTMLSKADAMGCLSVVSLLGTQDASDAALAPHPYMYTEECKAEFREIVLRILDGLELGTTKYIIEPWTNSFFYQPEDIREFIDRVGHPSFGLHLDQMNLINQQSFYRTTELINKTFDLLADDVVSVHLKDAAWDFWHMFLKWDEVLIGDGVMDYETYLKKIAKLPADMPCYCEHLETEGDYVENFQRVQKIADKVGVRFLRRGE